MLHNKKIVNLSHTLTPTSPTWTGKEAFVEKRECDYQTCSTTTKFRVQNFCFDAGTGTHIDAPAHCIAGGRTVDQLEINELIAPCFVIDASMHATPSSLIDLATVQQFKQTHQATFAGSMVFFQTNWSARWDKPQTYRNDLQFPALSAKAAEYLIEQGVIAIGIDTLGPDRPGDTFPVHDIVLGTNRYLIENLTNLNQLPVCGATAIIMPLLIAGATESPARIIGYF